MVAHLTSTSTGTTTLRAASSFHQKETRMFKHITASNGLGALLLRKVKTASATVRDTLAKGHTTVRPAAPAFANVKPSDLALAKRVADRTLQDRHGLFAPMFAATRAARSQEVAKASNAAPSHAGVKAVALDVPKSPMRSPGEIIDPDFNADDPRHVHAAMLRQSAATHDRLLVDMKAALKMTRNGSTGPEALS
jgi:hypothetical protein